jgi:hypothetical protein
MGNRTSRRRFEVRIAVSLIVSSGAVFLACSSSSDTTTPKGDGGANAGDGSSNDGGPLGAPDVCTPPPCAAARLDMYSSCGWSNATSTCPGGVMIQGQALVLVNESMAMNCSVTATANDGTVIDVNVNYSPAVGCPSCDSLIVEYTDGGIDTTKNYACGDAGAPDASSDAADASSD